MKHITLAEAREKTDELFEEIERGEVLTISKQGIAETAVRFDESKREDAREAIRAIMEARKSAPRVTVEEILAWRDEGRKY